MAARARSLPSGTDSARSSGSLSRSRLVSVSLGLALLFVWMKTWQTVFARRLRQRVSPAEAAAAWQAITRREEFEPGARVKLFSELSGHFRAKVEFPAEAVEGIADEQHVRNVVDELYRPRGADKK